MSIMGSWRKSLIEKYYSGAGANRYDIARNQLGKWKFEEESLANILKDLPEAEIKTIADIPIGTNRFAKLFESLDRVQRVYGIDLSADMLEQAMGRPTSKHLFARHDVISSPPNITCDTAVCFRFLNLFNFREVQAIIKNIASISQFNIILSIRLVDNIGSHDTILQRKIYLHHSKIFYDLLDELCFTVKNKLHYPDEKGGDYYVLHAARKPN